MWDTIKIWSRFDTPPSSTSAVQHFPHSPSTNRLSSPFTPHIPCNLSCRKGAPGTLGIEEASTSKGSKCRRLSPISPDDYSSGEESDNDYPEKETSYSSEDECDEPSDEESEQTSVTEEMQDDTTHQAGGHV
ncbi:hypothetical protein Pcinc_038379 [Petrolisthes cinctipes]|uniref:Uncharacterized protein n=1 Tax=Petrolisthes cinctipes TaxID=88211 RepID=A0AAE1BQW0_PETCI|nr:hypothetical protein Pcinc_038379 [Petrolisthes cinctipes]